MNINVILTIVFMLLGSIAALVMIFAGANLWETFTHAWPIRDALLGFIGVLAVTASFFAAMVVFASRYQDQVDARCAAAGGRIIDSGECIDGQVIHI